MRVIVVIFGVLVAIAGVVWVLQGIGVILGSFMSNNPTWIWIGAVTLVVGVVAMALGLRSGPPAKTV
jgi:hypothetical protein